MLALLNTQQRGEVARAKSEAFHRQPEHGEQRVTYHCTRNGCRGTITATVQAGGHISRGRCSNCTVSWCD